MDPTELRDTLRELATALIDQPQRPVDFDGWRQAALDLRDALDEIRDAVEDLDADLDRALLAGGTVTKRCAATDCGRWMVVGQIGRRRRTCSAACRTALTRSRRQLPGVGLTGGSVGVVRDAE